MKSMQPTSQTTPEPIQGRSDELIVEEQIESWRSVPGDVDDFIFSMLDHAQSER